ncbi:MAG: Crp/Fnr family transcriptional regulator [Fimbriimonas sp.]
MSFQEVLRRVPIFAELDEPTLGLIGERSRVRQFSAGKKLLWEKGEGTALYILLEGKVSVQRHTPSGRTILIATRETGDHFGEMSLLDGKGHSADIVALTDCRTLVIDREVFLKIVEEHPAVALSVIRTLTARLREQTGDLTKARSLDLMGKVCATLLAQADQAGVVNGVTQQRLADGTGASREAVNRTLQALREAGYIEQGRGMIRLLDRNALARRAEEQAP